MKKVIAMAVVGLGMLGATEAEAQGLLPLSAEVRGGVGFPTGDFGDLAETGVGFGAQVRYNIIPMLAVYGGYDWYSFGLDTGGADVDANLTDSGFAVGGQLSVPLGALTGLSPWVRAGAIFHSLEYDGDDVGPNAFESDRSTGFEVAGGLAFPLGMVISVTPSVFYRTYSPEFDGGAEDWDVSYFGAEVGLTFGL